MVYYTLSYHPYMSVQAMHFCYGLGAFVSPMIAEPFLLNEDCTPFIDNTTNAQGEMVSVKLSLLFTLFGYRITVPHLFISIS